MSTGQPATVGRIVHFYDSTKLPKAALITAVHGKGVVNLTIFEDGNTHYKTSVEYSDKPGQDHWSWPLQVGSF